MYGGFHPASPPVTEQPDVEESSHVVASPAAVGVQPSHWLIVVIGILVVLHFVGYSKNTRIDPAHISIGGYNAITITLISIVGITGFKVLFNRLYIPGFTELVNAA